MPFFMSRLRPHLLSGTGYLLAKFFTSETYGTPSSLPTNEATGPFPSMVDWPGELGFDVRVEPTTKSRDAQYSIALEKLFVNQKRTVNMLFTVNAAQPLPQLDVRAVAIY